jgi:lysine 2,3-aminomutase
VEKLHEEGVREQVGRMNGNWHVSLRNSFVSPEEVIETLGLDPVETAAVAERYPFRITRHYFDLIESRNDPVWLQCVPDMQELSESDQVADPLNETGLSPVPGLIHRYPDRVVLLISNVCAVYCRFCMRKRRVGCCSSDYLPPASFSEAARYISDNPAIRDVILSGGDPLLLEDEQLEALLSSLRAISHVEIIRIGTRVPATLPERVTPKLSDILKRYHPVYVNTHFNHPKEINSASRAAAALLVDAGIPLGNQTVLLKRVNDDPAVMKELMTGLLSMRIRPYYLHQMDLVKGTSHFRTSVRSGLKIMESLRGHVSGLAVPYYMIDLPEGKGKVPLLPGQEIPADGVLKLRTYTGEIVEYRDI